MVCGHCGRVCPSRKAYTDHRRTSHGMYYVTYSGLFAISPYRPSQ